jgi:hypothetical protein
MGETTELVLEGILCSDCGTLIDGLQLGFPRKCDDCEDFKDFKGGAANDIKLTFSRKGKE